MNIHSFAFKKKKKRKNDELFRIEANRRKNLTKNIFHLYCEQLGKNEHLIYNGQFDENVPHTENRSTQLINDHMKGGHMETNTITTRKMYKNRVMTL